MELILWIYLIGAMLMFALTWFLAWETVMSWGSFCGLVVAALALGLLWPIVVPAVIIGNWLKAGSP